VVATGCAGVPIRERPESEEKANLASVGKAEACIPLAPCSKTTGVWMPTDLAAQTAGWGEGLVECKAKLATCDRVGVEPWVYAVVGIAAAVAGGFAVAGVYELRDWLKR
jgi:hypothetical protein